MFSLHNVGVGGGKGVSDALQEEAAVAFCGFFSVPLTYKDKTGETCRFKTSSRREAPAVNRMSNESLP